MRPPPIELVNNSLVDLDAQVDREPVRRRPDLATFSGLDVVVDQVLLDGVSALRDLGVVDEATVRNAEDDSNVSGNVLKKNCKKMKVMTLQCMFHCIILLYV